MSDKKAQILKGKIRLLNLNATKIPSTSKASTEVQAVDASTEAQAIDVNSFKHLDEGFDWADRKVTIFEMTSLYNKNIKVI